MREMTFVAAGALTGLAAPSGAQEVTAADCGSKTYRGLFWPDGHGGLKGVPHRATDVPHVDLSSGKGKKFTEAQNVAYADGTTASTTATCTPAQPSGSGSGSVKSTTAAKQLVCTSNSTSNSNPVFVVIPESTVDYDGKACKLTKLPK